MGETDKQEKSHKGRTRSPSYPALGLEDAIRKAGIIYDDGLQQHWISADVLAEKWEASVTSGGFMVSLAALKQFGLLEDEGKGAKRKFRLSDLAIEIRIHDADSTERRAALKRAALNPRIHAELWSRFHGVLPATDTAIRVYLLKGRRDEGVGEVFNKDVVDPFIRQFRSTIAFAELGPSDKIPSADGDNNHEEGQVDTVPKTLQQPQPSRPPQTWSAEIPVATPLGGQSKESGPVIFFPLPGGNSVEIRLRSKLSQADFETVKQLVELSKASLVDPDK